MKRRFQFRLRRLERVRQIEEQIARGKWGEAEAVVARTAARVVELESTLERARRELHALRAGGELDLANNDTYERPIETLLAHLQAARALHAEQRTVADRVKEAWSKRRQALRTLERMEEKARERHDSDLARADQFEADEANITRAAWLRRRA